MAICIFVHLLLTAFTRHKRTADDRRLRPSLPLPPPLIPPNLIHYPLRSILILLPRQHSRKPLLHILLSLLLAPPAAIHTQPTSDLPPQLVHVANIKRP